MEIKAIDQMYGLFSTSLYEVGDVVLSIEGEIIDKPSRTTIQIVPNKHVDVDAPAKFINHSCNANCEVRGMELIAIKKINIGDEITFNYQNSEDILANPFICNDCGKWIRGRKFWKPESTSTVEQLS